MMPRVRYCDHRFQRRSLKLYIEPAITILSDYAARGFTLTVRQLYYQFIARNWLPNAKKSYTNLGWAMTNGRNAGLIDWDWLEDRSRIFNVAPSWDNPADILAAAAESYREDPWLHNQRRYIEVWVEKDALSGVFEGVCADYRLRPYPHRGHDSTSMIRAAGVRLARKIEDGCDPLILSFTDHDVAGLDMRRDINERLEMYTGNPVEVRTLGLTRAQVDLYDLPPNFAKERDPRYPAYVREHGPHCWELDALSPDVFDRLVRDAIEAELDHDAWAEALAHEQANRAKLDKLVKKMTPKRR
jgi:hypothetical protein